MTADAHRVKPAFAGPRPRDRSALLPAVLLLVAAILIALVAGTVAALGNKYLILIVVALLGAVFVIASPIRWTVFALYVAAFVIVGPIMYFAGLSQVQWVPSLMGVVVLVQVMIHSMRREPAPRGRSNVPAFVLWLAAFFLVAIFGTAISHPTLVEIVNSSRWYFFMWPVMLAFMAGALAPEVMLRFWQFLLAVVLIQVPMVLYQYLIVAHRSLRSSPWDAVVGTFPGQEDGGGQSAAMAIFMLILMLYAIARWRAGRLRGVTTAAFILAGLGCLALAEVKAAVMLIPVAVALYFRRDILKRPIQAIAALFASVILVAALFAGYQVFHYANYKPAPLQKHYSESTVERVTNALAPDNVDKYNNQIGRVTHLVRWWQTNVERGDLHHALFGYGMGATQATRFGVGELARQYPYPLDASSSSILLWETGLLGHGLIVVMLLAAALTSSRLSASPAIQEEHRIALNVGAVALVLLVITLPYKDFILRSLPVSLLLMLILGQAAYWHVRERTGLAPR